MNSSGSPLVSIIMTTFNSADHIRETLDSVLSQDYPSIEIVIADGGSTDGTLDVIRGCAAQHPSIDWKSEPDRGIYDGMNKAILRSHGDIIAVMNDLFTTTHAVSIMVKAIQEAEAHGAGAASSGTAGFDEASGGEPASSGAESAGAFPAAGGSPTRVIGAHADLAYMEGDRVVRRWRMGEGTIRDGWLPAHPTMYLLREVYEEYGLYDLQYHSSSDYEFMIRVLRHPENRLVYVPEEIIHMFYGGTSNDGVRGYLRNTREAYEALKADKIPHPAAVIVKRIIRTLRQFQSSE